MLRRDYQIIHEELQQAAQEVQAISHHRDVLREALETLDSQFQGSWDSAIASSSHADSPVFSHNMAPGDQESLFDLLNKRIQKLQAKVNGCESMLSIYRRAILGLYPDGATYGAAQYGGGYLKSLTTQLPNNKAGPVTINFLISVNWIEKEIADIKASFEEELRIYDAEVSDLRSRLRQNNSYTSELRRRFEDNVKSIYRSNKLHSSEEIVQHISFLNSSLEKAQTELEVLQQNITTEKSQQSKRHIALVTDVTRSLQVRDITLQILNQIDQHCVSNGIPMEQIKKVQSK